MNVLFIIDYHNQQECFSQLQKKAKQTDFIIDGGDCTIFSHNLPGVLAQYDSLHKPVYMIHGNHEEERELKVACEKTKYITFVHGQTLTKNSITFCFWGGGGFSMFDRKLAKKIDEWKKIPGKKVLVIHAPPYGTALDIMPFGHVGNKTILQAVDDIKPTHLICGHIHENEGVQEQRGKTLMINPGPTGILIEF